MGLLSKIFSNTRKPEGFWGRMMVAGMNGGSHAAMASWGLDLANVPAERFLIVNEDDGLSGNNEKWEKMIEGMHTYTPDELESHLAAAGFRDITVHQNETKHWLCVAAVK